MTVTTVHPLEPLTEEEVRAAAAAVRADGRFRDRHRFFAVVLHEPAKDQVALGTPRMAEAVLVDRGSGVTSEVVVDLGTGAVVEWCDLDGSHAAYLFEEYLDAIAAVHADERWVAALAERGVTDLERVQCDPWPAGNFAVPGEEGRRLVRIVSYVRHHDADNGYAHPIEGVVATVDVTTKEVVDVATDGVVPIPPEHGNYDEAAVRGWRTDIKPLDIVQPDGPSFTVEGHEVRWANWRFRVSMHPLDGLVLHTVGWDDGVRLRPVLHRAALAEMVVPYGSAAIGHRWKNAFDSGELGLGRYPFLNSLELGCDCLGTIHYFDVVQAGEDGEPQRIANAICLHEEDYGILWKHVDLNTFTAEVRRSRRLVVSSIHTVGNYEYGFYWYFYLDGTIQLEVKLTGILQTQAVAPDDTSPAHASLVAPGLAAPYHQHLFNFRLDLDVDGTGDQTVEEVELQAAPADTEGNGYGNALVSVATPLRTERDAQRFVDATRSRHWRVVNRSSTNRLGQPVAYRLLPGLAPTLLAQPGSPIARRAEFATRNLWVTPYDPAERRAAGYPVVAAGGDGLPAFTAGDRSVADTDVVLWYTFGVNHVPRPEDWPVMPVEYVGFTLSPFGFFERNPALDVAPQHSVNGCGS